MPRLDLTARPDGWKRFARAKRPLARLVLASLGLAGIASSDARAQDRAFWVPSFALSETRDDNVLSTLSERESDFVTRLRLGLEAGYGSTRFTIGGRGSVAGDLFDRHSALSSARARTEGDVRLRFRARRLRLFLDTGYLETQTPGELNVLSGLEAGRARVRHWSANPALTYQLDSFLSLVGEVSATDDRLEGGAADNTQMGVVGLGRRIGPRDAVSVAYTHRRFSFNTGESSTAEVAAFGWTRDVGARTRLVVSAGPRLAAGKVVPEVFASVRQRMGHAGLALAYSKTQTVAIGQPGAFDTDSLLAVFDLRPVHWLEIASSPGVFRNSHPGLRATSYRLNLEARWHMSRSLETTVSYGFDLQRGTLVAPDGQIRHGLLRISLVASPPSSRRLGRPPTHLPPEPEE
jgi:hypothetical protein